MSIQAAVETLQLPILSALAARLPATRDCVLCLSEAGGVLCPACTEALPRLGAACVRCAAPLAEPSLCGACRSTAPAFDAALSCFEYRFPLDRLVQRFKYGGDLAIGRWLGAALAGRAAHEPRPDVLVVPPLSRRRLCERGFNQALELAKVAGRELRIPVHRRGLVRLRDTEAQAGLRRRERLSNLRGAFACRVDVRGQHVGLVDDVMTTGATAEAIARVLHEAGADRVVVWALARAPQPQEG